MIHRREGKKQRRETYVKRKDVGMEGRQRRINQVGETYSSAH